MSQTATARMRPWERDDYGVWGRFTNRANAHVWRYEGGRNPNRWRWTVYSPVDDAHGKCRTRRAALRRATMELSRMTGAKP